MNIDMIINKKTILHVLMINPQTMHLNSLLPQKVLLNQPVQL